MPALDASWLPWVGQAVLVATATFGFYVGWAQRKQAMQTALSIQSKRIEDEADRDARVKELVYNMLTDTVKELRGQLSDSEVAAKALRLDLADALERLNALQVDLTRARLTIEELNSRITKLSDQLISAGIDPKV